MVQSKFSLTESQAEFVNQYETLGFSDKSAVVRAALEQLRQQWKQQQLRRSAQLYTEVYHEDEELRQLTDLTVEGWPE